MPSQTLTSWDSILSVLFFPLLFENSFLAFCWGENDPLSVAMLKRVYLLLPVLGLILASWVSSAGLVSAIVRSDRSSFLSRLMLSWWDLGKAILSFWVGTLQFALRLLATLFGFARLILFGVWVLIHDVLIFPFQVGGMLASRLARPGTPWIAVTLTLTWGLVEAMIFTYVTSPLVLDTLSNLTGGNLSETAIRAPLFLFMLFVVLGSYAVLCTWTDAIRSRNVFSIAKISAIEGVTVFVEVMFLYREFVDALVPWFAQHSARGFDLGVTGTLAISSLVWVGVRGLSWFLFASHGSPVIMAVIRGEGLPKQPAPETVEGEGLKPFALSISLIDRLKAEGSWVHTETEALAAALLLPPLQLVAASLNFVTVLFSGRAVFEIPIRDLEAVMDSRKLLEKLSPSVAHSADPLKAE